MSTESETSYSNLLIQMFKPGALKQALPDNILLYNWLHGLGNIIEAGGDDIKFPIRDQRQAGAGFVGTGSSTLPTATQSGSLRAQFGVRFTYGVGEFDEMVMKATRNSNFSYMNAEDQAIEDVLLSLKHILNSAWYDDGRCRLGIQPAADDQTTVTLLQPILMLKGYRIDLVDATDNSTKLVNSAEITAVDHQGVSTNLLQGTVTHGGSAASGSAATDYFTPEDAIDGSGNQLGPFGLLAGCSNANPPLENWGAINRSTAGNEAAKGNLLDNSGTNQTITTGRMNAMLNLIKRRTAGSVKMDEIRILHNRNITIEIFEQLAPDKSVVVTGDEAMKLAPGFDGGSKESFQPYAKLNGVNPMFQDESAPANRMFFLVPRFWNILQSGMPELVTEDGSPLHRFEGRPAFQFRYRYFNELYNTAPFAQGVINDVAETNPVA